MAVPTGQPTAQLKSFLDELMGYIPADKQEAARATFSKAHDTVGTLDQAIGRVNQTAADQRTWWDRNKDAVVERDQLRVQLGQQQPNPNPNPKPQEAPVDMNVIEKAIIDSRNQVMDAGLGLATTLTDLGLQHYKEFGEALNTRELAQKAIEAKLPLDQFYAQSVSQRRTERQQAEHKAQVDAAREEGRKAGMQDGLAAAGRSTLRSRSTPADHDQEHHAGAGG
jgi:hypothetical protein